MATKLSVFKNGGVHIFGKARPKRARLGGSSVVSSKSIPTNRGFKDASKSASAKPVRSAAIRSSRIK